MCNMSSPNIFCIIIYIYKAITTIIFNIYYLIKKNYDMSFSVATSPPMMDGNKIK